MKCVPWTRCGTRRGHCYLADAGIAPIGDIHVVYREGVIPGRLMLVVKYVPDESRAIKYG